jgi:hypothetical protein
VSGEVHTVFEPAADDPRIVAAIDAQERLGAAMQALDMPNVEALMAPDLLVHAPMNAVVQRESVLARLRSGQIAYEAGTRRSISYAGVRGDTVVLMGEETVKPVGAAPNAGKVVRRRFTDVWRNEGGAWMLAIRQATVTSID